MRDAVEGCKTQEESDRKAIAVLEKWLADDVDGVLSKRTTDPALVMSKNWS